MRLADPAGPLAEAQRALEHLTDPDTAARPSTSEALTEALRLREAALAL